MNEISVIKIWNMSGINVSVRAMLFNTTFNNITVISWRSVLFQPEYPDKTTDLSQVRDKLNQLRKNKIKTQYRVLGRKQIFVIKLRSTIEE